MRSWWLLRSVGAGCLVALIATAASCSSRTQKETGASGAGGDAGESGGAGSAGAANEGRAGAGTGGGGSAGTSGSAGSAGGIDLSCAEGVLDGTASGSTDTAEDRFEPTCGSGDAPDIAFEWTAPATDYYEFDTVGSSFDTVLTVVSDCAGAELGCNNNTESSSQSRVVVRVEQDQTVLAVVDGYAGDRGDVTLNVKRVICPDADLTGQPLPAELTTVGGENVHDGACGGAGYSEKTIRWMPETAGLYQFTVASDAFAPVLYLEQGLTCGGDLLQCSYNVTGGYPAQIARYLEADEAVTLTVDSTNGEGEFSLDIELLDATCPSEAAVTGTVSGQLADDSGATVLSGSCSWAGNADTHSYPEHSYPIHIELTPFQFCGYYISGATLVHAVYLLRGSRCDGEEVSCTLLSGDFDLQFDSDDNGDYVLVIENQDPFSQQLDYTLETTCP